jgi:formamidopyrimidine-DNA glycosylase
MPELPEVETVVRDLRPLVVGRTVTAVRAGERKLRTPWRPEWAASVVGGRIEGVRRRGKWIVMELASRPRERPEATQNQPRRTPAADAAGSPRLIVHLGMTGQFTAVEATTEPPDHLHLVFELDRGRELRFRDVRRFGSATVLPDAAAVEAFFEEAGLGPEPFGLDPEYFRAAVRGSTRTLKAILLDQRVVAGVGNIYADEACFRARLNPARRGKALTAADADRLREAVEAVLTTAIEHRGSTIRDYVGGSGERGGFQDAHAVYGRTGEPCPACGAAVRCVRLSGRSSHFCPVCQAHSPRRLAATRGPRSGARPRAARSAPRTPRRG